MSTTFIKPPPFARLFDSTYGQVLAQITESDEGMPTLSFTLDPAIPQSRSTSVSLSFHENTDLQDTLQLMGANVIDDLALTAINEARTLFSLPLLDKQPGHISTK